MVCINIKYIPIYKRRKLAKEEKLKSFGANPEVQERKKPDEKPFTCKI